MLFRGRIDTESLLCMVLLAVLPVVVLAPAFFQREAPFALDALLFEQPWEEQRPVGLARQEHPFSDQHIRQIYPEYAFIQHSMEEDLSLLWNPSEGFGQPFFALWRTRVLSPFTIPFYLFPMTLALQLSVFLKLLVAGWAAFYTARRLGLLPPGAMLAAVAFQLSGAIYLWSSMPMSDVLPWLPLLILEAERLVLGMRHVWPRAAIVLALMLFGGAPQTVGAVLLLTAIYIALRRVMDRQRVDLRTALRGSAMALALALALAAVQLAPYLEYLGQAAETAAEDEGALSLRTLLGFVQPGGAAEPGAWAGASTMLYYVGIVQVFLLALWFSLRRYIDEALCKRLEALALAATLTALIPVVLGGLLPHLPLLGEISPAHYAAGLALAFGLLAAAAAEEWVELDPESCKGTIARLFVWLPIVLTIAFAGIIIAGVWSGNIQVVHLLLAVAAAIAVVVLLGVTALRPSGRLMGYGLSGLSALVLWWAFHGQVPYAPTAQAFPETAFTTSLQQMEGRIGGSGQLRAWPLSPHGIEQVYSPSGVELERRSQFMERVAEDPLLQRRSGSEALLLTKEDIQGPYGAVRPMLNIQKVFPTGAVLFRDLGALPRARMVYAAQSPERFDPELVRSEALPVIERATLPASDEGAQVEAQIVGEHAHAEVAIEVEKTRPGVLVLADTNYPGWKAAVDGEPAEIVPVDGVFRGVQVGEGAHNVRFWYAPVSLRIGQGISLLAALILVVNLWALRERRETAPY